MFTRQLLQLSNDLKRILSIVSTKRPLILSTLTRTCKSKLRVNNFYSLIAKMKEVELIG